MGRLLQAARQKAGLTQQELCQKADISYSTLAKIERGAIRAPSFFTVQRLSEVLGLSLETMMGGQHKEEPASDEPRSSKGRSKTGVSFIFFDINGCLVRFFHRAFTQLAHDTGASADTIETTFWHYNDAVCRGEMTLEEFNQALAQQIGSDNLDWQKYYMGTVDAIKEMHEVITWAADNYRVGLLSNIMPGFIPAMKQNGLLPNIHYDAIIDSSEVGAIKPEKEIYDAAMAAAQVPPEEILLVDDSRTNLMAAEKLGWHVMWFDDFRPEESAERVRQALELN